MRATKAVMTDRPGLQMAALGVLTTVGPSVDPAAGSVPNLYYLVILITPSP